MNTHPNVSMQKLVDFQINAFAVQLLAESLTRHPLWRDGDKVMRPFCFTFGGVKFTLDKAETTEAVRKHDK